MLFLAVTEIIGRAALDSSANDARNRRIFAWRKPALTCVFCPESDVRMAARSSRRVVTRTSVDGDRVSRSHAEKAVEQGFPSSRGGRPMMTATGQVVTDLSHLGVRRTRPGRLPRAGSVCCVEQAQ
jgi:hypothetical protein